MSELFKSIISSLCGVLWRVEGGREGGGEEQGF